ncbi:MAG: hypothetical protein EON55_21340 [Alphaproteobacteria bacterium]|nr:MAG: hypothetical protein EON55_21340 [Alphaproteobacteria bacterium]
MTRLVLGLLMTLVSPAQADDAVSGTWEGSYVCGQGGTALTLILRPGHGRRELNGLFHFHGSASNPGVPEGCFTMTGSADAQSRQVKLSAGAWLLQPFGYVTVDLAGTLDPGGNHLSGQVIGPLCQGFKLRRVKASAVPIPSACLGSAAIAAVDFDR